MEKLTTRYHHIVGRIGQLVYIAVLVSGSLSVLCCFLSNVKKKL